MSENKKAAGEAFMEFAEKAMGWRFVDATPVPNPGSDEAKAAGCTCPRMDNAYGKGYMGGVQDEDGNTVFVYTEGCPVHTTAREG